MSFIAIITLTLSLLSPRPVWDGRGYYPADGVQPLCPAAALGHHARIGHRKVTCKRDGSQYAWE